VPAANLVPGDSIHLRMGDLSPADIRIVNGNILLDQSALTGESVPVEAGTGMLAHAAAIVRRGEATGEVVATGLRTYFGKTAELVSTAKSASHLQTTIFSIVKTLIIVDALLVSVLLLYAAWTGLPFTEVILFALILIVASVPVALPATFTLATALGSTELARNGVLVTRLSAIEEAAGMDVLCTDKTGTITENRLTVTAAAPFTPSRRTNSYAWQRSPATRRRKTQSISPFSPRQKRGASLPICPGGSSSSRSIPRGAIRLGVTTIQRERFALSRERHARSLRMPPMLRQRASG